MFKKIIIFGFPHTGTTILRSIIGHIENVYEIVDEVNYIDNHYTNYDFVLFKFPYLIDENELLTKYIDYIKIFIIRNPLYVFSSLNKRFNYEELPEPHTINCYINTIKQFNIFNKSKTIDNLFLIKYEDIFEDNYKNLIHIFDKIGFNYNKTIFDNSKYTNKVQYGQHLTIPTICPSNTSHSEYRLFQINNPFKNNNDKNKIDLTESQRKILTTDINILELYPENALFFCS
jgi:hypothetical protein